MGSLPRLRPRGLMTVGPLTEDPRTDPRILLAASPAVRGDPRLRARPSTRSQWACRRTSSWPSRKGPRWSGWERRCSARGNRRDGRMEGRAPVPWRRLSCSVAQPSFAAAQDHTPQPYSPEEFQAWMKAVVQGRGGHGGLVPVHPLRHSRGLRHVPLRFQRVQPELRAVAAGLGHGRPVLGGRDGLAGRDRRLSVHGDRGDRLPDRPPQ